MFEDTAGIRRVVLACGTVDLRKVIDGMAMIIGNKYQQNLFEKGTLLSLLRKTFRLPKRTAMDGNGLLTSL